MVVKNHGEIVADLPAAKLADEAPVYQRESKEPAYLSGVRNFTLDAIEDQDDPQGTLEKLCMAKYCVQKLGLSTIRPHGAC